METTDTQERIFDSIVKLRTADIDCATLASLTADMLEQVSRNLPICSAHAATAVGAAIGDYASGMLDAFQAAEAVKASAPSDELLQASKRRRWTATDVTADQERQISNAAKLAASHRDMIAAVCNVMAVPPTEVDISLLAIRLTDAIISRISGVLVTSKLENSVSEILRYELRPPAVDPLIARLGDRK